MRQFLAPLVLVPAVVIVTHHAVGACTNCSSAVIANQSSNNVSVIDADSHTVTHTIAVGTSPRGAAFTPEADLAYVVNYGVAFSVDGSVSVISTASWAVTSTVALPAGTHGVNIAVNPQGTQAYVPTETALSSCPCALSVIDTMASPPVVIRNISLPSPPKHVAVDPKGMKIYVSDISNNLNVINAASHAVTTYSGLTGGAFAINPQGNRMYAASGGLKIIDLTTASPTVVQTLTFGGGVGLSGVAVTPDGRRVFGTDQSHNNMRVVDVPCSPCASATENGASPLVTGLSPMGVAVDPTGATVFVGNYAGTNVSIFDANTFLLLAQPNVGTNPRALGKFVSSFMAQP
jgi:YVTN family beta-propeller protein